MADNGKDTEGFEKVMAQYEHDGKTAIIIATDGQIKGVVAVQDTVKESAKKAIQSLHDQVLEIVMLTGENSRTAAAIARKVNIDTVIVLLITDMKANHVNRSH